MAKVSKKNKDVQRTWLERIDRAKKVRSNWKALFEVEKALLYFDGVQNPGEPEEDWITVNKIYSHIKAQLPALYDVDPYFYVNLKRSFSPDPKNIAAWDQMGKIRGSYLNYLKTELDLKAKVRLAIHDAHFKYGVIKTHYAADEQENPDAGEPMHGDDEQPLLGDKGEFLLEPDTIPINDRYVLTRVHPDDFIFDEDAGPLEDNWNWCGQRIRMTVDEAIENPNYNKKAVRHLIGRGESKDDEEKNREQRKKGDNIGCDPATGEPNKKGTKDIFVAWEIYNIKSKTWVTIAEEGEIPLIDEGPMPPGIEDHPFSILRFTLRDDSPYPIPPMSPGIPLQDEYNKARSSIQKHRKRFNRKYEIVQQGITDESELSKLEHGDDGTFIKVNVPGTINPITDAPLDQMRYMEMTYLNRELNEMLGGVSDEARGIASADSATQAGILEKRLEIKEGDSKSEVMDFIKSIARKLDQLVQTHISRDEAIKISGPQGDKWEIIKTSDYEDIDGEFGYDISVGTTLPKMPQVERASWQAFLAFLGNAPQFLLSKRLLKKTAEMHHIDDELLIEEIYQVGQMMMKGQVGKPGATGSQAGIPENNPVAAVGGMAGGSQSLNQPGAGNL